MKIVHVVKLPPHQGGMEKYAYLLAKYAIASGHQVSFVFDIEGPFVDRVRALGCQVYFVKMRAPYDLLAVVELVKLFKDIKPDVVHTHFMRENFLVIDASKFIHIPAIFSTVHRLEPKNLLQALANRIYSRGLTKFIAVSPLAKQYLLDEGVRESKIVTILNGVELGKVDKTGIRKQYSVDGGTKALCYVGRFTEEKGHALLLRAFAKLEDQEAVLLLAGDGALLEEMKALAKKLKIFERLLFLGNVEDGYRITAAADIYIQPSLIENMPMAVEEAMLLGVPVVASDCDAHKLLLKNGELGTLFENGSVISLSKALNEAIGDKSVLQKKSKEAKQYALLHLTAAKMWEAIENIYEKYAQFGHNVVR